MKSQMFLNVLYEVCANCGKKIWFWQKIARIYYEGMTYRYCEGCNQKGIVPKNALDSNRGKREG